MSDDINNDDENYEEFESENLYNDEGEDDGVDGTVTGEENVFSRACNTTFSAEIHFLPSSTSLCSFGIQRVLAAPVNNDSSSFPASLLSSRAAMESFLDLSLALISHY
mgnify:CR=1 FL=1